MSCKYCKNKEIKTRFCSHCGEQLISDDIKIIPGKIYFYSSKEINTDMVDSIEEKYNITLSDYLVNRLIYLGNEIDFDYEINIETEEVKIINICGIDVSDKGIEI